MVLKSKSDYVVDQVVEMVLNQELQSGDRLPPEMQLAAKFGVSRITIREAFKKLSLMGIVSVRQGQGTFINKVTPENYMRPLLPILIFSERNMAELYDIRRSLEGGAAALAAKNPDPAMLRKLEQCQQTMKASFAAATPDEQLFYTKADQAFHQLIFQAANNIYFQKVYQTISSLLDAGIEKTSQTLVGRKASLAEHSAIIEAIREQDPERTEQLMLTHIANAKAFYLRQLK